MRSLSIGATGMLAQQLNVEVISHNIANMNTTAYTRRRVEFQDLLYQNLRRTGSQSADDGSLVPVGVQVGLGGMVRVKGLHIVTRLPVDLGGQQVLVGAKGRGKGDAISIVVHLDQLGQIAAVLHSGRLGWPEFVVAGL